MSVVSYDWVGRQPLTGVVNFRDVGGYVGFEGRTLRRGLVFRSDSLADLTADDIDTLSTLNLASICDLRSSDERAGKPNRSLASSTTTHAIGFLPHRAKEMVAAASAPDATAEAMRAEIRETYRRMPLENIETFKSLFDILADRRNLPALVHCTSGKDRTGFAIALFQTMLGVGHQDVMIDYLLSNKYRRDLRYLGGPGVKQDLLDVMMETHETYLDSAFGAIKTNWGSVSAFLIEALGLTVERQASFRHIFLGA